MQSYNIIEVNPTFTLQITIAAIEKKLLKIQVREVNQISVWQSRKHWS